MAEARRLAGTIAMPTAMPNTGSKTLAGLSMKPTTAVTTQKKKPFSANMLRTGATASSGKKDSASSNIVGTTKKANKIFAFTHLADETMWSIIAIFCGTVAMVIAAIAACIYLVRAIRKWRTQEPKETEAGATEAGATMED